MVPPAKRAAGDDTPPPSRRLRVTTPEDAAPGSSNPEPPPPSPPRKRFVAIVLVVLFSILPVKSRSTDSLRIGRLEMGLKALRNEVKQVRDTFLRKQVSIKKMIRALSSKLDNMKGPSPNHHKHEHLTREGTHQEGTNAAGSAETETEAKDTSIRLRFFNEMKPPVYHDDDIKSIKLGIFDGERLIESGPLSKLKIEVLALEGNFPHSAQGSWTSKEFHEHVALGRDGKGNVLAGKGTNAQLINGECHLGSIRFRESSCRARSGKFIVAARIRSGQTVLCGRVQEAVMNPVVVLDRRNKYHEKSHPPMPDDEVYRLEKIAINGKYHKRLEEENIRTVEHFSKALYKDEDNLARILQIKKKCKDWEKMVHHAQECCLQSKPELKSYRCEERNVVLFFNYVHRLVGATFGGYYVACDMFDQAQKILVDKLKMNAYAQLDGLPGDHVMKDNIPVRICMDTDAGADPSCMAISAPQQINSGHHIAEHQVGSTPASEVLRSCAPHDPNCIPDPNSTYNYQASSTKVLQNVLPAGGIPTVESLSRGLNESSFAIGNDGPSTSFYAPYHPTAQNYRDQGTGFAAQQQHFAAVVGMPLDTQTFLQHQADNNNWGSPVLHQGEMPDHDAWPGDDTFEAPADMYMASMPQPFNNTGAASLPNDGTMGLSGSAQQEWSQCHGNMPGNTLF